MVFAGFADRIPANEVSMPAQEKTTARVLAQGVAPFAPLVLALTMGHLAATAPSGEAVAEMEVPDNVTAVKCVEPIPDFQRCHDKYPTGCSAAGGYDPYLNFLKNVLPQGPQTPVKYLTKADYDALNQGTPSGLGKTNHADFKDDFEKLGEGKIYGVIGYLYYSQPGGQESSNCGLTKTDAEATDLDYHIGIGFDPALAQKAAQAGGRPDSALKKELEQNSVIVEMTPHYRDQFERDKWTLEALKKAVGRQVGVTGQLLVDSEHNTAGDNCALASTTAGSHCWRYSIWELHPVTSFMVCNATSNSCAPNSAEWVDLGQWGEAAVASNTR
jgi:hypothetical protein